MLKKDSKGICFIGERKFKNFLAEYLLAKPGTIVTLDNKIVGTHAGLIFYTIGQRQGLNIGGLKGAKEAPWYVARKDIPTNTLVVTQDRFSPALLSNNLKCQKISWISGKEPQMPVKCSAKIRYRQNDQECTIIKNNETEFLVEFLVPQWAITPGQSVVFYDNEECLGGAIIN